MIARKGVAFIMIESRRILRDDILCFYGGIGCILYGRADKSTSLKGLSWEISSTKNLLANKQLPRLGQNQGIII